MKLSKLGDLEIFSIPEQWLEDMVNSDMDINPNISIYKILNGGLTIDSLCYVFDAYLNYKDPKEWPLLMGINRVMDHMIVERLKNDS